jgi:hypothetical protein
MDRFDNELYDLIRAHVPPGSVLETLGNRRPNWISDVTEVGVLVETERSRAQQTGPQLVPARMIQTARDYLTRNGRLTHKYLLATDGLNVKRSAAVCSILARLPGIEVESTRPIVLRSR